jgi:hypothetical protein
MGDDDTEARCKRAAELRKQIADIVGSKEDKTGGQGSSSTEQDETPRRNAPRIHPISPREFIERRMRELDREKDEEEDGKKQP